ncbi:MAG: hypothetical protein B7X34_02165 [Acidobacteriia bacterium 12-62-4]|nr:MAG: hypothetical protein B7X34_02165 [Acidobacteriia bacterium 12-62-4]
MKLNAVMSEQNNLSIVLFDEIEKAAGSLQRLLLGVLDKATLRLGDNSMVNFERSLIFLTSNLGAREMARELRPEFGLETAAVRSIDEGRSAAKRLEIVAVAAVKRKFAPEFVNRIDLMLTYQSLDAAALEQILELQVRGLQEHLDRRLGERSFQVDVPKKSRQFLLRRGTSVEYGARELKRTMHRFVMQPLAALVAEGRIAPNSVVRFELNASGERLDVLPGRLAA